MTQMRTFVIGDVHGCAQELAALLRRLDREDASARLVFVGDFFTKGPEPEGVVEELLARRVEGREVVLICGNHEIKLRKHLRRAIDRPKEPIESVHALTVHALRNSGLLHEALELVEEAMCRISYAVPGERCTVIHGGIDPLLGIALTPDAYKVSVKSEEDDRDWWWDYDGRDGLIVVGHKPFRDAVIVPHPDGRRTRPIVVNIDTGCAYGGKLTAYDPAADTLLSVSSQQPGQSWFMNRKPSSPEMRAPPGASASRDRRLSG
ncbi:MAG: metallophosphoesterase [Planctomycetota bacterium]|nr:metallophosphoesterase [Planctomycetota bacterium]MDA1105511.1 metallophosphoesterase [Planctomycetota bacterium]